jgi:hypothetical protein
MLLKQLCPLTTSATPHHDAMAKVRKRSENEEQEEVVSDGILPLFVCIE